MIDPLTDWGVEWGLDAGSARLAALLAMPARVEPELLRAVRVICLPDADVGCEQAVWFCALVDARSEAGISFDPGVLEFLRSTLAQAYLGPSRGLIDRAHDVIVRVHADISPLLRVEEELVWADVTRDGARAAELAESLVRSAAAGRPGIERWLSRVWTLAPEAARHHRSGWVLSQIAGGARETVPDLGGLTATERAALLTHVTDVALPIARGPGVLRLGVPEAEADVVLPVPDTMPRLLDRTCRSSE